MRGVAAVLALGLSLLPYVFYRLESTPLYPGSGIDVPGTMEGQNVIVTGSSQGLGFYAAKEFYALGANVVVTGRTMTKTKKAAEEISAGPGKGSAIPMNVDIANFADVRRFVREVEKQFSVIHVLILNAGMGYSADWPKNVTSPDGLDLCMATNHFGHFLLTKLLWTRLAKNVGIVGVGGGGMWRAGDYGYLAHPDRIRYELPKNRKERPKAYFRAKLAQRCFAQSLQGRLDASAKVNFYLPGISATAILGPNFAGCHAHWLWKWCGPPDVAGRLLAHSAFVPSSDVLYAYWLPRFIFERFAPKERLRDRMGLPLLFGFPSFVQKALNWGTLHSTVGPECDAAQQEKLWNLSAAVAGIPP